MKKEAHEKNAQSEPHPSLRDHEIKRGLVGYDAAGTKGQKWKTNFRRLAKSNEGPSKYKQRYFTSKYHKDRKWRASSLRDSGITNKW
jgi:hypothetical protein